ncbi:MULTISPECIES: AraC family transcriptional regulator [Thalassolituus]|uniref:AraC family transcriptional regulator n=1 Tax=Thalassolituus TaxID=187492 RepID=UPI002648B735|nr:MULTISPECIES: AraC family transcriptional regulator [Thalassolituus]|tara:strand:- start:6484 stop:7524 length:1041 start_codon:yes stop_codon:yes gene_type:complete
MPGRQDISAVHPLFTNEYLIPLLELLANRGISPAQLVTNTRLSPRALGQPGTHISAREYDQIVRNAYRLSNDPLLGLEHGRRMSIASHGFLGFAVMASETLGEGLSLAVRYAGTRTGLARIRFRQGQDECALEIIRAAALPDSYPFIAHNILSTLVTIARFLTRNSDILAPIIRLVESAQRPVAFYEQLLGCDVEFNCDQYELVLPKAALSLEVSTANSVARHSAEQECERLLAEAPGEHIDLASRVRTLLISYGSGLSLEDVAERLRISARSLNRQLAQLNTSFRKMVEEVRREQATRLLGNSSMKVSEIAEQLGYTDTSNFVRAFRKWMGITPLNYRKLTKHVS